MTLLILPILALLLVPFVNGFCYHRYGYRPCSDGRLFGLAVLFAIPATAYVILESNLKSGQAVTLSMHGCMDVLMGMAGWRLFRNIKRTNVYIGTIVAAIEAAGGALLTIACYMLYPIWLKYGWVGVAAAVAALVLVIGRLRGKSYRVTTYHADGTTSQSDINIGG